jgi:hypothetical protein
MAEQSAWPYGPYDGYQYDPGNYAGNLVPADQARRGQDPAHTLIADLAALLKETRVSMAVGAVVLGCITIGLGLEAGFAGRALQPGMVRVITIGLLLGLLCCWLTAVTLLAMAGRPVLDAVSELRWKTGAPLDPRAPWLSVPPVGDHLDEWTWTRAHLLIGAARMARYRVQRADTWVYITASYFAVWTVIVIVGS